MSGEVEENFSISQDGMLTMKGRVCVSDVDYEGISLLGIRYASG